MFEVSTSISSVSTKIRFSQSRCPRVLQRPVEGWVLTGLVTIGLMGCAPVTPVIDPPTVPSTASSAPVLSSTPEPTRALPTETETQVVATPTPTAVARLVGRAFPAMAYDAQSKHVILFGGLKSWYAPMSDTWSLDPLNGAWTPRHPAQSPTGLGIMAYDDALDRILLYVGSGADPASSGNLEQVAPLAETWAYDFEEDTWANLQAADTPRGLLTAAMAYDAESDKIILFGGAATTLGGPQAVPMSADTWVYDGRSNAWTRMDPALTPPARSLHAMTYDAGADRVILFGGYPGEFTKPFSGDLAGGLSLNDTWTYDFNANTWAEIKPAASPAARSCSSMVYDSVSERSILVGGSDGLDCSGSLRDAWAFEAASSTWTDLGSAPQLTFQGMAFAEEANEIVAYVGGSAWIYFSPAYWIFDPEIREWKDGFKTSP